MATYDEKANCFLLIFFLYLGSGISYEYLPPSVSSSIVKEELMQHLK
jgi:hypothetical protein